MYLYLQSGQGTKNWCDGIEYRGEWKDGKMHGMGCGRLSKYNTAHSIFEFTVTILFFLLHVRVYTMMDGTVIEGLFEEDEFAGYAS